MDGTRRAVIKLHRCAGISVTLLFKYSYVINMFFMPPTSKKLRRHIGLGPICLTADLFVSLSVTDRILKFGMRDEYEY